MAGLYASPDGKAIRREPAPFRPGPSPSWRQRGYVSVLELAAAEAISGNENWSLTPITFHSLATFCTSMPRIAKNKGINEKTVHIVAFRKF